MEAEAYWVSKVQAERAAWEMAGQLGVDLVTILPGGLKTMRLRCRRCPQQPAGCAGWQLSTTHRRLSTAATGPHVAAAATVPPTEFIMGPLISARIDGTSMGYMKVGCPRHACHWGAWRCMGGIRLQSVAMQPACCRTCQLLHIAGPCLTHEQAWVEGKAQSGAPVFADVRDVARAHILAAENPAASGRYIVANSHTTPAAHISAWLQVGGCWGQGAQL